MTLLISTQYFISTAKFAKLLLCSPKYFNVSETHKNLMFNAFLYVYIYIYIYIYIYTRGLSRKLVPFANIAAAALRSRWCACVLNFLILCQGTDTIFRHLNSLYASCCLFIMFKKIENPAAFNSEHHLHSVLGQKRRSACGLLASRLHNQRRCLLRHT